jgi:hypothetical protein
MEASAGRGDLIGRARAASEGGAVPEEWGELIELEVGDHFVGRHRGHDDGGKSGAWLAWDEDGAERFVRGCYRLDQEYAKAEPTIGDDIAIFRGPNYKTRFDDDGGASGLGYGLAVERNDAPLPEASDDGIPFLCRGGNDTLSAVAAAVVTG